VAKLRWFSGVVSRPVIDYPNRDRVKSLVFYCDLQVAYGKVWVSDVLTISHSSELEAVASHHPHFNAELCGFIYFDLKTGN